MGVSTQKASQKLDTKLTTEAISNCGKTSASNITNISGLDFSSPPDCNPPSSFNLKSASLVNASCVITNLQTTAAKEAAKLNSKAQTGLGVAVTNSETDMQKSIEDKITAECGSLDSNNIVAIKDTKIRTCAFNLVNDATAKSSCEINNTQTLISDIAANTVTDSKGSSILGLLFGEGNSIFVIIIILVIVVIIGAVLFKMLKSGGGGEEKNETNEDLNDLSNDELGMGETGEEGETGETGEQMGGFNLKNNKSFTILLIILLILLVFALLSIYYKKTGKKVKKMDEEDMKKLNNKINDATEIAGFSPYSDNYYRINC